MYRALFHVLKLRKLKSHALVTDERGTISSPKTKQVVDNSTPNKITADQPWRLPFVFFSLELTIAIFR